MKNFTIFLSGWYGSALKWNSEHCTPQQPFALKVVEKVPQSLITFSHVGYGEIQEYGGGAENKRSVAQCLSLISVPLVFRLRE